MHPRDTPMAAPSTNRAAPLTGTAGPASTRRSERPPGALLLWWVAGMVALLGTAGTARAQVTAADVVDRPSLRAFVERARAHAAAAVSDATEQGAFDFFEREFRPAGPWRHGSIYLAVNDAEGADRGRLLFHATRPDLEGRNMWSFEDKNGVLVTQELIARAGRDFVEYYFDDPGVVGDEEDGSFKVAYADILHIAGHRYIITSGFYPATGVPIAPPFVLLLLALLLGAGGHLYLRRATGAARRG